VKEHEDFNFKGWLVLDSSWIYQPIKIKVLQVCVTETAQMARIPNINVVETSNFANVQWSPMNLPPACTTHAPLC